MPKLHKTIDFSDSSLHRHRLIYPKKEWSVWRFRGKCVSSQREQTNEEIVNTRTQTEIIPKIQQYLATQPVERAWLFGSFSRGEEREDSDVDILVDFKEDEAVGLFKYCSIMNGMTDVLGRNVDLVQNGTLLPFAIKSVEQDKILIYERTN